MRGKEYETRRSTLEYFSNTLLGSEVRRQRFYNPYSKKYHFDTREDVFDAVLFFYQSRGILARPDFIDPIDFWEELVFFGLARQIVEQKELPTTPWKKSIWVIMEYPQSSETSKLFAVLSTLMATASVAASCLETSFSEEKEKSKIRVNLWFYIEMSITIFFTIEYLMRLATAPDHMKYVKSTFGLIDLTCILPFYFGLILISFGNTSNFAVVPALYGLKLIKTTRLLKLIRFDKNLKRFPKAVLGSLKKLSCMMYMLSLAIIFCSYVFYYTEYKTNDQVQNIFHAMWFTIVTVTTVGYGDITPSTMWGQLAGTSTIFCGTVTMFYLFLPVYSDLFEKDYKIHIDDGFEIIQPVDLK